MWEVRTIEKRGWDVESGVEREHEEERPKKVKERCDCEKKGNTRITRREV